MTEMRSRDDDVEPAMAADRPSVSAHECSRDRTVFTEDDNTDAWIATDLTVTNHR